MLSFLLCVVYLQNSFSNAYFEAVKEMITDEDIGYINSVQSLWVASKEWVGSMTLSEFKSMLPQEQVFPKSSNIFTDEGVDLEAIPVEFDSREQWPFCVVSIRNQSACGAGYAISTAACLSYRYCITSSRFTGVNLSPQQIINCDTASQGCTPGFPNNAWVFLSSNGTGVETCVPYAGVQNTCSTTCANGTPVTTYKSSNSVRTFVTPAAIQNEILNYGPVTSSMTIFTDFAAYKSGIYNQTSTTIAGFQSLLILGWGFANATNYWICANSFGTVWGMSGYIFIAFGDQGIDGHASSELPNF